MEIRIIECITVWKLAKMKFKYKICRNQKTYKILLGKLLKWLWPI